MNLQSSIRLPASSIERGGTLRPATRFAQASSNQAKDWQPREPGDTYWYDNRQWDMVDGAPGQGEFRRISFWVA